MWFLDRVRVPGRRLGAVVAALSLVAALDVAGGVASAQPKTPPSAANRATAVVLVRARGDRALSPRTELRTLELGDAEPTSARIATLEHAQDAVVRGDVAFGKAAGEPALLGVALVADEAAHRDAQDYGAALFWAEPSGAVRRLATSVVHASRPLVGSDGAIYVQRGVAGRGGSEKTMRVDSLEIDAVTPGSGAIRVVATYSGYAMHLAGALGTELCVYRVGPAKDPSRALDGAAELVAVDRATGRSRIVTTLPPFARDFSVDATRGAVLLSNRDDRDTRVWVVERVDWATGARTRLSSTRADAQTPFAHPDGTTYFSAPLRAGLTSDRAAEPIAPFGAGYTYVTNASTKGWLALVHVPRERGFDRSGFYLPAGRRFVPLAFDRERVEVLGFVGDVGGLR